MKLSLLLLLIWSSVLIHPPAMDLGVWYTFIFFHHFKLPCTNVWEELLHYPHNWHWLSGDVGVSKMLKFYVKVFSLMGKVLSG